ncbi:tyrosine-type recombinase/integrase [Vagococcus sp. BWB3-3]|uniref:Tyrosine-type recombinase/integrase n=1 Tax=Vagococcus allomyrinae TaxID=2794353 RepID=A0A940PBH5_9ENTE|nr:tyrosine-type recombinase/integrase [Vagococcus allomyrinae]MBP1040968.1 tyrosine-type recombinase/integrase [Vagococcus allomyrinae]
MEALIRVPLSKVALPDLVANYIEIKRAAGFLYKTEAEVLKRMIRFMKQTEEALPLVTPSELVQWCAKKESEKNQTASSRGNVTQAFINYLKQCDYDIDLPELPKLKRTTYVPYIFTSDEINRFFRATDTCDGYNGSLRHIISPIIFRLIYGCGLRVSEATRLSLSNIDFKKKCLILTETKSNKVRFIPFSKTLGILLENYCQTYVTSDMPYIFRGKYHYGINRSIIYKWFRYYLEKAQITHRGRELGPRLHDFRHTFCVHALHQLEGKGVDLYCGLSVLSTYIGHVSIKETQNYLRLTPEFFPSIFRPIYGYICLG